MKEYSGFPKEVGAFNDYDGDKVLCVFGQDGQLLEAASIALRAMTAPSLF